MIKHSMSLIQLQKIFSALMMLACVQDPFRPKNQSGLSDQISECEPGRTDDNFFKPASNVGSSDTGFLSSLDVDFGFNSIIDHSSQNPWFPFVDQPHTTETYPLANNLTLLPMPGGLTNFDLTPSFSRGLSGALEGSVFGGSALGDYPFGTSLAIVFVISNWRERKRAFQQTDHAVELNKSSHKYKQGVGFIQFRVIQITLYLPNNRRSSDFSHCIKTLGVSSGFCLSVFISRRTCRARRRRSLLCSSCCGDFCLRDSDIMSPASSLLFDKSSVGFFWLCAGREEEVATTSVSSSLKVADIFLLLARGEEEGLDTSSSLLLPHLVINHFFPPCSKDCSQNLLLGHLLNWRIRYLRSSYFKP